MLDGAGTSQAEDFSLHVVSSRDATTHRESTQRLSIRATVDGNHGDRPKEPVLQLFVMPAGLPQRRGLRVVAMVDGHPDQPLGATQPSDRHEPLFSDPLEFWDEAAGKEASVPLRFLVKALRLDGVEAPGDPEETLAVALIKSDALRRLGLYNPREGAAVGLPLRSVSGERLPPEALLHCYVHVGYSVRRKRQERLEPSSVVGATGASVITASPDDDANGAVDGRRRPILQLESSYCPSADPEALLLRVRGRNASRHRALRLEGARLLAPPPWVVQACDESSLHGQVLPPGGFAHFLFEVRPAAPASAAATAAATAAASSSAVAELIVAFAPLDFGGSEGVGQSHGLAQAAVHIPLHPPSLLYPFAIASHSICPAAPQVGEVASLQVELQYRLPLADGDSDRLLPTPLDRPVAEAEVEVSPGGDWMLLGAHKQRVALAAGGRGPSRAVVGVLAWKLVPLSAGHVALPAMALHTLPDRRVLPAPPYLRGGTVWVADAPPEV